MIGLWLSNLASGAPPPPPLLLHPGTDDAQANANTAGNSTAFIKYLGTATNLGSCGALCTGWINASDPTARCQVRSSAALQFNWSSLSPLRVSLPRSRYSGSVFRKVFRVEV